MDDLCSLGATCSSMRRICGNPVVGRRALHQCRHRLGWDDLNNYYTLLASLTQPDNPEACFLTGIPIVFDENRRPWPCLDNLTHAVDGGHNLVAYLVAILLYRHSGDAHDDDTVRWYMRRVEGEEESWVAVGSGGGGWTSWWLHNKGCVLCQCEAAFEVLRETRWS
jgi:hypothetical protein